MRITTTFLAVLLAALTFQTAIVAQDKPVADENVQRYDFLFYYMGAKIGWMRAEVTEQEYDGRKIWHESDTGVIKIRRSFDGQTFVTEMASDFWYEKDWTEIKTVDVTINGEQTVRVETERKDDKFVITETIDDNKPVVTEVEIGDKTVYCDLRAWQVLKDKGLKPGATLEFWGLEDDEHALVEQTWTVKGKVKRKLSDKRVVEGTEIVIVKTGRKATVIMGEEDNMPIMYEDVSGFGLERIDEIPDPFEAEPITLRNVMDANVGVKGFEDLKTMDIHFEYEHDDGDGMPTIADSNGYHEVIRYDEGYALRLKAQKLAKDFKTPAYPMDDVDEELTKYLQPTAMCQSDDKDLIAVANKLTKDLTDSFMVAKVIMEYADSRLEDASGNTGSASAKQAFEEKQGDCTEHAALFVALARAAGLPARNASGIVYISSPNGTRGIFGYHQWAEVWLGEWVPVDATVRELGTSARYILFEYDEPGHTHGSGRSSRCIKQNIEPVIDAYILSTGKDWKRKGAPDFKFEESEETED